MTVTVIDSSKATSGPVAVAPSRMEEDVHILVLVPFRDIVEKANLAIQNADDADPPHAEMRKAAQTLVKEGERALKKIQPICKKHLDEYGQNFVNALKENDDIANFRTELNDLLWDFESFIEVDEFDADEFTKLHALSRKSAPRIYDILMRMKLEHPKLIPEPPSTLASRAGSVVSFSDGRPASAQHERGEVPQDDEGQEVPSNIDEPQLPTPQLRSADSAKPEEIPPEPPDNPWELVRRPAPLPETDDEGDGAEKKVVERRRRVSSSVDSLEAVSPVALLPVASRSDLQRPQSLTLDEIVDGAESPYLTAADRTPSVSGRAMPLMSEHQIPPAALGVQRHSQASSASSAHPSVFDAGGVRDSAASFAHSPPSLGPRPFPSVPEDQPDMCSAWPLPEPQMDLPSSFRVPVDQPGLEPVHLSGEEGLIPVLGEASGSGTTSLTRPKESDCTINIDSSFYQYMGFCDGAKDVIRGGAGVKRIRKPGMGAGTTPVVAKCRSCMFELDWTLVEADVNMEKRVNYYNTNIGFRLRFLSKSHIAAKHIDDQLYGCLFCVQLGRTTEESDATVFFSQKQLFSHLARHPRPLPPVPGLTVIEAPEIPPHLRNNYDLHFPYPPVKSVMIGLERLLAAMPTVVATESFRQVNNTIRHPPDLNTVLQFASGARIVGVEFPGRYGGEWAIGWADNSRGAFPVECVKLVPPDQSQIRKQAGSNLRAVARWKRSPKDKDSQWLKFDKGEAITGISFPSAAHWCWSGYNSKQKWGIFPQSYMEPNTLSEALPERLSRSNTSADRASIHSHESNRAGGLLGKLSSIRYREGRAPSSVDSGSSSTETAAPRSPRLT